MNAPNPACIQAAALPDISRRIPALVLEMTQAYHDFEQYASRQLRQLGLTSAQFAVLLALSDGPTKSCKALCAQTAITKGSLTGIIDRLVEKGLVQRADSDKDRRSSSVLLTAEGRATFARVADEHFACLRQAFAAFQADELERIEASFRRFRQLFNLSC